MTLSTLLVKLQQWATRGLRGHISSCIELIGHTCYEPLRKPKQGRAQVASGKKGLRAKLQKADDESIALQVDPGGPASLRTTEKRKPALS